ncbi:MAG: leucyl aminopeptidase [Sedimentisphaerales bacterium]|nr:leucyl aminopeptidase [Sedimentisphaerales bacterium]
MARQAKRITVTVSTLRLPAYKGDILAIGLFEKTSRLPRDLTDLDVSAEGAVRNILKLGDFTGKANETAVLYLKGKSGCNRIMLVGLGDKQKFELKGLREAAGTAIRKAQNLGAGRLGLALHLLAGTITKAGDQEVDLERMGQAITEGAIIGRYDYQDYLPEKKDEKKSQILMRVSIIEPQSRSAVQLNRGRRIGTILAEGQNQARAVANKPGNEINPPSLAREAQRLARRFGLKCRVFNDRQLNQMGMNALLAVGSGSVNKSRLIMLEYNGKRGSKAKDGPDLIVVGKAITFDSGGISIKPSAKMGDMKFDKSGGCAVLGVMTAAAQLKLPLRVVGLVPSAENLPSHTSYRPGDIIRTYSGKTVEIDNTDAEGRMILCDALAYAVKMKPRAIVDMATLTGACVIALGEHYAGLFGNNDALIKKIQQAAQLSGDLVWTMPSGSDYLEQMKSKIADLCNAGGREGGSCTAAAFLGAFVGDIPWAHIDIAAVADTDKEKPYRSIGATGFSVRLVLEYLRTL